MKQKRIHIEQTNIKIVFANVFAIFIYLSMALPMWIFFSQKRPIFLSKISVPRRKHKQTNKKKNIGLVWC